VEGADSRRLFSVVTALICMVLTRPLEIKISQLRYRLDVGTLYD